MFAPLRVVLLVVLCTQAYWVVSSAYSEFSSLTNPATIRLNATPDPALSKYCDLKNRTNDAHKREILQSQWTVQEQMLRSDLWWSINAGKVKYYLRYAPLLVWQVTCQLGINCAARDRVLLAHGVHLAQLLNISSLYQSDLEVTLPTRMSWDRLVTGYPWLALQYCESPPAQITELHVGRCYCDWLPRGQTGSQFTLKHALLYMEVLLPLANWKSTMIFLVNLLAYVLYCIALWTATKLTYSQVRSQFYGRAIPTHALRTETKKTERLIDGTIKLDPENHHARLARERNLAINTAAIALAKVTASGIADVCGVPSRHMMANLENVRCFLPRDVEVMEAAVHGKVASSDLQLLEPGQEIRGYDRPVLMSLCDWHYTQDELVTIMRNYGGVIVTQKFEPGTHDIYGEAVYTCTTLGVSEEVVGGRHYVHGYHEWKDGAILGGAAGLMKAVFIREVGAYTLYALNSFAGEVHEMDFMVSRNIRRPMVTGLRREDNGQYWQENEQLDFAIVQLAMASSADQAALRRLLTYQLTARKKEHVKFLDAYEEAALVESFRLAHRERWNWRHLLYRFSQHLPWFVYLPFEYAGKHLQRSFFTHAVDISSNPVPVSTAKYSPLPQSVLKAFSQKAGPAVDDSTRDHGKPVSGDGGSSTGPDERNSEPQEKGNTTSGQPTTTTQRKLGNWKRQDATSQGGHQPVRKGTGAASKIPKPPRESKDKPRQGGKGERLAKPLPPAESGALAPDHGAGVGQPLGTGEATQEKSGN